MWRGDELDIEDTGPETFWPERLFEPRRPEIKTAKTL
jgi:hypothetical protein